MTIAGIHPQPYGAWMEQLARNLTDPGGGLSADRVPSDPRPRSPVHACLRRDPDGWRCPADSAATEESQSQRLCRAVRPLDQEECLSRVVPLGEAHVRQLVSTSSSNTTITRETIRAATTNSCSDRHLRSTRTPTLSGGSASADFSASTTERPHEGRLIICTLRGRVALPEIWRGREGADTVFCLETSRRRGREGGELCPFQLPFPPVGGGEGPRVRGVYPYR